jgi:CRP-like cAMP-binding protein
LQGCFRWVKNHNGEERTFDFAIEGEFVTNYYSILTQKPSEVDIIAVEKSIVVCVDAARMLRLFDSSFSWQKIGRHLAEQTACYSLERLVAAYYESPQTRYEQLMKTAPELFLRIPHYILANYLGMTKETLSRLRNPAR